MIGICIYNFFNCPNWMKGERVGVEGRGWGCSHLGWFLLTSFSLSVSSLLTHCLLSFTCFLFWLHRNIQLNLIIIVMSLVNVYFTH